MYKREVAASTYFFSTNKLYLKKVKQLWTSKKMSPSQHRLAWLHEWPIYFTASYW